MRMLLAALFLAGGALTVPACGPAELGGAYGAAYPAYGWDYGYGPGYWGTGYWGAPYYRNEVAIGRRPLGPAPRFGYGHAPPRHYAGPPPGARWR